LDKESKENKEIKVLQSRDGVPYHFPSHLDHSCRSSFYAIFDCG